MKYKDLPLGSKFSFVVKDEKGNTTDIINCLRTQKFRVGGEMIDVAVVIWSKEIGNISQPLYTMGSIAILSPEQEVLPDYWVQ